ncbi:hypothetical protein D3C72_2219040 [compost metagenome]
MRGGRHQVVDLGRLRHVGAVIDRPAAGDFQALADRLDLGRIAKSVDDDIVAMGGKGPGDGQADAAGRSGDDDGSVHVSNSPESLRRSAAPH